MCVWGLKGVDSGNNGIDGRSAERAVGERLGAVWTGDEVAAGSKYDGRVGVHADDAGGRFRR